MKKDLRYAIINPSTNKVCNVIVWDGREFLPPSGVILVKNENVNVGDEWDPIREEITHIHVIGAPPVIEEEEV